MRLFVHVFFYCITALSASASVTLSFTADQLKTANGAAMPVSGLVMVVVSTSDATVSNPTADAFVSGDDQVIFLSDLSTNQVAGVFAQTISITDLSGAISTGDPIALFWFPTLSQGADSPGTGATYGRYDVAVGQETDGSAPWVVPSDGASVSLSFLTTDALTVPSGGSNPASAGLAPFTVAGGGGSGGGSGSGGDNGGGSGGGGTTFSLDGLLSGTDVGGGARFSSWFGFYFPIADTERWHFHNDLGWIYPIGDDGTSMWYFDVETADFWWTGDGTYPFTFRSGNGTWYFFLTRTEDGSRWFSNQSTGNSEVLGNILQ
ncbi:hypothetical protein [Rubellicoccus peritrichatus]|uniref:Uncharacterized protein n=1 Tax=Rubellicoccus peritrichatus TaxID=3080537 RepID=A0AAQ3L8P8_9BACT|nr:hypothetical protein [Puniceicoccus sp. CR14]WOO40722.1 hypothetical protein RZN69_19035 [Puniceicoccus sp. CR14]